jgi:hypothetical protein
MSKILKQIRQIAFKHSLVFHAARVLRVAARTARAWAEGKKTQCL